MLYDVVCLEVQEFARLHGQRRVMVGHHADRIDLAQRGNRDLAPIVAYKFKVGIAERPGAEMSLIVGILDRFLEVVSQSKVIPLAYLLNPQLGGFLRDKSPLPWAASENI